MILRKWWALCALFFVPALSDCATLEPFSSSTCGNGVIDEATEDCDTFPKEASGKRLCGAAGAAGQCRLLCNRPDAECPPGWGCSVEGFCRRPKGAEFELATEPVSVGVSSLVVGDFDGDGRKDIFGTSALVATSGKGRFHYFGAEAALVQTVPLPANITSPFVQDFDGDGKDDLGFGYNFRIASVLGGGIAVVQGQADRAIASKLFPSFEVDEFEGTLVPLAGPPPTASDPRAPYLGIGQGRHPLTKKEASGIQSADADERRTPKYAQEFALPADQIAGTPLSAPLFPGDPTSTCGQVVVAFKTGLVNVYSPCTPGPVANTTRWAPERGPTTIDVSKLPAKRDVTGIHIADEDGDGFLDVLIGVEAAPTSGPGQGDDGARVYVARGDGKALAPAVALSRTRMPNLPLVSGDINGDGITDYVLPGAVLVSLSGQPGPPGTDAGADAGDGGGGDAGADTSFRFPIVVPSKVWTSAVLADVNSDGVLDVIGASTTAPDVDVMQGRRGDDVVNMTAFSITTTGVVTTLTTADVDGDRTNDIVIVQRRATAEKLDWEIAVAYGRPSTMPPEAPRTVGRTRGFRQVFADGFGVGIATSTAQSPKLPLFSLAFLLGAGERQPFAPIILQDENALQSAPERAKSVGERNWVPRTVAPGAFTQKGRIDLGAVAQGTPQYGLATAVLEPDAYGVWISESGRKDLLEFSPSKERIQLLELERARPTELNLQMKVKDIDGDGIDEVVTVTPDAPAPDLSPQVAIRILHPQKQGADVEKKIIVEKRAITTQGRLELFDMDQDGKVDLVAILLERETSGRFTPRVNVFYGDGAGGFSKTPKSFALAADSATDDEKKSFEAVGTTVLTTVAAGRDGKESDVVKELVILTRQRLFRVKPGKDSVPVEITGAFKGRTKLDDASDIAAGDFDGDGVEDLAIAAGGTIRIIRQVPELR